MTIHRFPPSTVAVLIALSGGSGGGDDRWGRGPDERMVVDVVRDVRRFLDHEILSPGRNTAPPPPLKKEP